jgi:hypothetical protein
VQFGVNTSTRNTTRAKLYDKMEAGIMYVDWHLKIKYLSYTLTLWDVDSKGTFLYLDYFLSQPL